MKIAILSDIHGNIFCLKKSDIEFIKELPDELELDLEGIPFI